MTLDLEKLKALCEKATQPGPYNVIKTPDGFNVIDANGFWVGQFGPVKSEANYFAAAATYLPALIAEVERLRAALDEALDHWLAWLTAEGRGPQPAHDRLAALRKLVSHA